LFIYYLVAASAMVRERDDDEKSVGDMNDDELDDFASSQGPLLEKVIKSIKKERDDSCQEQIQDQVRLHFLTR
jgi:hypothetical protein